jgi:hypothetical protein
LQQAGDHGQRVGLHDVGRQWDQPLCAYNASIAP